VETLRSAAMLSTLAEKVRPEHCAILVVDLQNDFCADGGAMHREGRDLSLVREMLPQLERFITQARAAKVKCVWIRNVYNTAANWYLSEVWLEQARRRRNGAYVRYPVCEPDEWNGDFYRMRPMPEEPVVTKHRYGAFEGTDLDLVLRSNGIRTVIMTGVATNVCVETTARQAFLRDYYVVFTRDGTATFTRAEHEAALHNIDQFFGQVVGMDEVLACWSASPAMRQEAPIAT
jgi:ureidoacrylate peracid hydrolase